MATRFRRGRKGGRRANYAKQPTGVGKMLLDLSPTGWVNWLGFLLFGFLFLALIAETISAIVQGSGNDWVAALIMAGATGYMAYLFVTTPFADEEEAAMAEAEAGKRGSKS